MKFGSAVKILIAIAPLLTPAVAQQCNGLPSSLRPNSLKTLKRTGLLDRVYRIYTPSGYDATQPSKVVLIFHGWGGSGRTYTRAGWADYADTHNYILVAPDGLADPGTSRSWTFPGSADGVGLDGWSITTCNDSQSSPDYCYPSCELCPSRCGWTHCLDDDFQFVVDLIQDLHYYVCVDDSHIYAAGISNGGMFVWSLGQNSTTAPLLAGISPIIGLPHHDYNVGKGTVNDDLPVIGIYGTNDPTVPPGDGTTSYTVTDDGEAYYYVDASLIHTTWAYAHGCSGTGTYTVAGRTEVVCETLCNGVDPPPSVDCRADMGHESPAWTLDVALKFFEHHANGGTPTDPPTDPPTDSPSDPPTDPPTDPPSCTAVNDPCTNSSMCCGSRSHCLKTRGDFICSTSTSSCKNNSQCVSGESCNNGVCA